MRWRDGLNVLVFVLLSGIPALTAYISIQLNSNLFALFLYILVPVVSGLGYPYFLRFLFPFIKVYWVMLYGAIVTIFYVYLSQFLSDFGIISEAGMMIYSSIFFASCFISATIFHLKKCFLAQIFAVIIYVITFVINVMWILLFLE